MSIAQNDTANHGIGALFARLRAVATEAFERAEQAQHHRLGSAFLSPETLQEIRRAAREASGQPCR